MDSQQSECSEAESSSKRPRDAADSSRSDKVKKARASKSAEKKDEFNLNDFTPEHLQHVHLRVISQCKYITEVVATFNPEQKQAVRDIGFGCLLDLDNIDIRDDIFLPFLLNYNGSAMTFSNGKETVLINSTTIKDVLGLPLTDREVVMEKSTKRSVSDDRLHWNKFVGARNSSHYLGKDQWKELFLKYPSGDSFKQLFVFYSMTMFLCTRTDGCPSISYCPSISKADEIATYNWSAYVANSICEGVKHLHESLVSRKKSGELLDPSIRKTQNKAKKKSKKDEPKKGSKKKTKKKVILNVKGCMLGLVLAVLHKFKVRDMDFSKAPIPYITFWKDGSKLANAARVFGLNLRNTVLAVDVSALARAVLGVQVSEADHHIKKLPGKEHVVEVLKDSSVVEKMTSVAAAEGDSSRKLVLMLPSHLMTDAEIESKDIPDYSRLMMKLQRNAIAMCELNLELANRVTSVARQHSQSSMSQDDDLVMNDEYFAEVDAIVADYMLQMEKAKQMEPLKACPLARKMVSFDASQDQIHYFERDIVHTSPLVTDDVAPNTSHNHASLDDKKGQAGVVEKGQGEGKKGVEEEVEEIDRQGEQGEGKEKGEEEREKEGEGEEKKENEKGEGEEKKEKDDDNRQDDDDKSQNVSNDDDGGDKQGGSAVIDDDMGDGGSGGGGGGGGVMIENVVV